MLFEFLSGAVMFGWSVIAGFFFLAYRRTGDVLFGYFAGAFVMLALERALLAALAAPETDSPYAYVIRIVAFGLIIAGVVEKNRRRI